MGTVRISETNKNIIVFELGLSLSQFATIAAISFFTSFFLSGIFVWVANRFGLRAEENHRSLHRGNILTGGGASVVLVILLACAYQIKQFDPLVIALLISTIILAIVSFIDDIRCVPIGFRLLLQIVTVSICLYFFSADETVISSSWPLIVDRIITGLCWIWFINLFNFMDGIDGLASSQAVAISVGVIILASMSNGADLLMVVAAIVGGSCLGFLPWNWHPAKIILGDVGAIPLGFLVGFLLIQVAIEYNILTAIILPLYFVLDASATIIKRLFQGKKIWLAHREHFYQRAVSAGTKASYIVVYVSIVNLGLIVAAISTSKLPVIGGIFAIIIVIPFIIYLHKLSRA